MRSKNIDTRNSCGYDVVNGNHRNSVEVPQHKVYNPDPFQSVGETILGTGYAGKPLRKEWFYPPRGSSAS